MLAGNFDPKKAKFPYCATPKIDGIRFLMVNGRALSRTFKPIRNEYIQKLLSKHLPDGIDGELTCGDTFQSSTSAIMRIAGEPDFKAWIFDYVDPDSTSILPFIERFDQISDIIYNGPIPFKHQVLGQSILYNIDDLNRYEEACLNEGYEGVMLRDPYGTYKFGRSSTNEGILLKVKRFEDAEATVIRIDEKMSNQNIAEKDNFGRTKRSSCLDGMVPMETTGALFVRNSDGLEFSIGSGLNDEMRDEIWKNKSSYIGKLVKYKYFPQGVKDLPRHPVFLGFRDPDDM
ncbi:DNA ligase-product DNA complex - adenylate [Synechococcus phage S-CRM01]|uniref:DNA ligase-product DNA complex - adenylate n=1 Tax=Synechococcus phage S-CRM01 TaxID=1026955 RepID=UPI000209E413|nr:DNA ligase-product DNA complex - adenylate [Synechococcus phage S-CRM01]AEC53140.1 DNA ligase-product DNA complex - adenylate [Synechococcus phage S-CRM01]